MAASFWTPGDGESAHHDFDTDSPAFSRFFALPAGAWKILTWGGLRGGISVALALSLPHGKARDVIVSLTYVIAVFSILVQGLSIGPLIK